MVMYVVLAYDRKEGKLNCLQSGEAPDIPLVLLDKPPTELRDRCKVVEKMFMIPQYAFAGDYTGKLP